MPIENFRTPFTVMSVARYNENWHTASVINKGPNPTTSRWFKLYFHNPVDQEVNIQFEHTPSKQIAPGCQKIAKGFANYNILLGKGNRWLT